jgi:hypothetical protein
MAYGDICILIQSISYFPPDEVLRSFTPPPPAHTFILNAIPFLLATISDPPFLATQSYVDSLPPMQFRFI